MSPRDFLHLAKSLVGDPAEAEWRSAVSRGYYACFHVARELLSSCGFTVPRGDRAHGYLWLRLGNCGDAGVTAAASDLQTLRKARNQADYDLDQLFAQSFAAGCAAMAEDVIRVLEAAGHGPVKTQITDAMKVYERDVLKQVTWHP